MSSGPQPRAEAPPVTWYGLWVPRVVMLTLVVLGTGAAAAWIFRSTAGFLVIILGSFFASFALHPGVQALTRRGWRPGLAAFFTMAVAGLVLIVFFVAMFGLVIGQTIALIELIPGWIEEFVAWANSTFGVTVDPANILREFTGLRETLIGAADDIAGLIFSAAGSVIGLAFQALTAALFVFYILADEPRLRRAILSGFPSHQQRFINEIWVVSIQKTGSYLYSRAILAAISAVYHAVVFTIIDVPSAFALGLFVGAVSQFIPNVGTYLAGFLPTLVALLDQPIKAVYVLAAVLIYQQIENLLISPRITAGTMDLHPAVAFAAAIVGLNLLGAFGALIALPVAASITALIGTYAKRYEILDPELLRLASEERRESATPWWRRGREQGDEGPAPPTKG